MIATPECWSRGCIHYIGVKNDGNEATERVCCSAFSNGIPDEIAYGDNEHLTPLPDQKNEIVFKPAKP